MEYIRLLFEANSKTQINPLMPDVEYTPHENTLRKRNHKWVKLKMIRGALAKSHFHFGLKQGLNKFTLIQQLFIIFKEKHHSRVFGLENSGLQIINA